MAHIHNDIDFTVTAYIVFKAQVLLILHKKLGLWLPVGGHIELSEDPEQALIREVKEECGLDVQIFGIKPKDMTERTKFLHVPAFMDIHRINDRHRHIGLHYFCTSYSSHTLMNEDELSDLKWFTVEELEVIEGLLPEVKLLALNAIEKLS